MIRSSDFPSDTARRTRGDEELLQPKTLLDGLFELAPDAVVLATLRNARILRINREFTRMFGYTSEEAVGNCLRDLVMPDSLEPFIVPEDPDLLAGGKVEREAIRQRKDGTRFYAHITGKRIQLSNDEDAAYLIFRDISERKQAEAIFAGEKRLLEIIAAGAPLGTTLDALCRLAEDVDRNSLTSILLLDRKENRLRNGAGPSLPPHYVKAIDGASVGLGIGPCAAAAHLGEQVISLDFAADERWSDEMRALASAHGLRTCWSTPIKSSLGRVLGTFAIYPSEQVSPTHEETSRIKQLTHLASIAIERADSIEALHESEKRYERVTLAAQAGFWDWDVTKDEFYISPRLLEMAGFPPGTTFVGREDFMRRAPFYPEDRDKWQQAVKELFASGGSRLAMEVRSIIDGETIWTRVDGMCFRDEAGRVVRWTGSSTDITERKRAEEALREQTERLQLGQAAMRMIIMDWNIVEDRLTWSDSPEWLRGPMPASGRYPLFKDQVHAEDRDSFLATRSRALETLQVQTMEFRVVRTDGEVIWVLERKHAFSGADGKAVRMLAAMFDITDRKRTDEARRLSEQRYALAAAGSNDGIWDWDLLTNKMFVSERAQRVFGLEAGPTERPREEWHAMIAFHPVDHQVQRRMVEDYLSGERSGNEGEWRVRGKDGAYRWIRIRSICLRNAAGQPIRMAGSVSDIDAQKKAEEALRQSEERYALAVDGANQGIFDWDLSNDRVFHSRRAQELFGLQAGESWRPRHEWAAMIRYHPEDLPLVRDSIRRHLNGEKPTCDGEFRIVPREGEVRWLHQRGIALRDASGKAYRMAGSIEDVTERKVAADALRESEARFRALTALWSDWYWRQDEALRFTYSSAPGRWPDGSPRDSAIGMTRWDIPGIAPLSSSWTEHRQLLAERKPFRDFEYCRHTGDGRVRYVSSSGTPIFDDKGEFRGYQGVACDITERKDAEEKLRSRQEMVKLAQKAAGAVAFEWRAHAAEGKNRWSPDLEAMYGIPAGSYDGTEASLRKLIHPEDWAKVRAAIKSALKSGDLDAEYRVIHPDGAIRWLQAKGRTLFDPEGKPERVVGFMFDVTDRHAAEEELQRMEQQLRQAQRLEALGTLAGGIAHDFNNLLGAILGYGEMALRDARAGSRLRRDIESIMIAGERGHALVERILAFSRSGLGERVAVHVEAVVRETLALFAAKLPRRIVIESRLHADNAAVMGDPTQIHQVLMNLLTNAVHAMSSGGTLRVSLDRLRLDASLVVTTGSLGARDYVALDVSDSGGGIPPEIFEKIFDPFFTTKEVGVGTGLGLSLVHGIVTGLGGAIDVATTVGKGSMFKVYLPISGDVAVSNRPRRRLERKTSRTGCGRVMVIDDEETLVKLATETLTELGCSAVGFTSSAKALEAFLADPAQFDAVITDESMPGMSGSELIYKMRSIKPTIPVLLVSGYLSTAVVERARKAGATEVLKKPVYARQLQIALQRILLPRSPSRDDLVSSKRSTGSAKPRRRASAS